ncbi:hypothetical protein UY3_15694 [Chelonia mydas]|uniref:Uncharacterized protein n=1 Tax=Chelonia mydas TaxID=8469 RepID=M7ARF5_CHEMY|nr:hypothetical protein UY3_15694 [Chelonia mydas]
MQCALVKRNGSSQCRIVACSVEKTWKKLEKPEVRYQHQGHSRDLPSKLLELSDRDFNRWLNFDIRRCRRLVWV